MSDNKTALEGMISELRRQRDEVKLQMHLAGMEAKDEYERLATKVDQMTDEFEPVSDAVEETADNVVAALGMLAEELKEGFKRVAKAVTDDK